MGESMLAMELYKKSSIPLITFDTFMQRDKHTMTDLY